MIDRLFTQCMLRPQDLAPSQEGFKVVGAFNPGVIQMGDQTMLLVRVVEQPVEQRDGYEPSPWFNIDTGELEVDWLERSHLDLHDPRCYFFQDTGLLRLRFISHLRVLRSSDGKTIDDPKGRLLLPQTEFEEYGIEDPRITQIGETFYITYVIASRHGAATSLMSTRDFQTFERHGIIFCPENKDVVLFPEKIDGQYMAIHRPVTSIRFRPPEMWVANSPDLIHWGAHGKLAGIDATMAQSRIGGGTPPLRTEQGWLTIYHGSSKPKGGKGPGIYTAGALLLDPNEPSRVLAHTPEPIMAPEAEFETTGFVNNVVFPTAIIPRDEHWYVYYGAADESVGVTAFQRDALMNALEPVNSKQGQTA